MKENNSELKRSVTDNVDSEGNSSDISIMNTCIAQAREIKATQLGLIKSKGYDFAPEFKDMTIQLYLLGVMWKCAEKLGSADAAYELAFTAMEAMLVQDGIQKNKAAKRIAFLKKMAKLEDNHDALAVVIGYESEPNDNSLAEVFDHYINDMQVSGAFWRLYDRGRKIMLYGGLFMAFVTIWFVTLFMPGNSVISTLAAGLIAAALFVIPVFLIGIFMYRVKIKKINKTG